MLRRDALRNIILASIGVSILPSCDFESFKTYQHLPLKKRQFRLIRAIQKTILPLGDVQAEIEEPSLDFMLKVINDCLSKKEINKYLQGLYKFENHIATLSDLNFDKQDVKEQLALIDMSFKEENTSTELNFFMKTNKELTVDYLSKSRYYQTTYFDYEFMPGRYLGCINV